MRDVNIYSKEFAACVKADHPSPSLALEGLLDPAVQNEAVAFHRHFAFVRGPLGLIFLGYKADIIGTLPNNDLSEVRLGKGYSQNKEIVDELRLFKIIAA